MLRGTWTETPSRSPPNDAGDFEFTISDCKSFTGKWRYGFSGDNWNGDWSGNKIEGSQQEGSANEAPPQEDWITAAANEILRGDRDLQSLDAWQSYDPDKGSRKIENLEKAIQSYVGTDYRTQLGTFIGLTTVEESLPLSVKKMIVEIQIEHLKVEAAYIEAQEGRMTPEEWQKLYANENAVLSQWEALWKYIKGINSNSIDGQGMMKRHFRSQYD